MIVRDTQKLRTPATDGLNLRGASKCREREADFSQKPSLDLGYALG